MFSDARVLCNNLYGGVFKYRVKKLYCLVTLKMNQSLYIMQYLIYTLICDVCLSAENVQKLLTQFCAVCNMTAIHRRHICALCFFLFIHQAANMPLNGILLSWHSIHNHYQHFEFFKYSILFIFVIFLQCRKFLCRRWLFNKMGGWILP